MLTNTLTADEELLTTTRVARDLDVSEQTVRRLEQQGRLPAMKTTSGQRLFRSSDVQRVALERRSQR